MLHPPLLSFLVDSFRVPFGGPEACVVVDRTGALHVLSENVPGGLPAALQSSLVQHELSRGRAVRSLPASTHWFLLVEGLDQPRGAPGLNDPVVLEGDLYGPFGGPEAPGVHHGGLTLTRGDFLAGWIDEAPQAFVAPGLGGVPVASFHAAFPADGEGNDDCVTAYLLPPPELGNADGGNAALLAQLLFDVLVALQHDLREVDPQHAFATQSLPVPDRRAVEEALERDGWEIRGDEAVRLDKAFRTGLGGLLVDVLGVPEANRRVLPVESGVESFLALAQTALMSLGEWPSVRYRRFRERVGGQSASSSPKIPRASSNRPPPLPDPVTDWRADFGAPPGVPAPVNPTGAALKVKPRGSRHSGRNTRPTWMDDFE